MLIAHKIKGQYRLRVCEDPLWSNGHATRLPNGMVVQIRGSANAFEPKKKDSNMWPWTQHSRRKLWVLNPLMSRSEMWCKDLDRQPQFIVVWLCGIGDWHSFLVRSPSWHISVSRLLQQQQQERTMVILTNTSTRLHWQQKTMLVI